MKYFIIIIICDAWDAAKRSRLGWEHGTKLILVRYIKSEVCYVDQLWHLKYIKHVSVLPFIM